MAPWVSGGSRCPTSSSGDPRALPLHVRGRRLRVPLPRHRRARAARQGRPRPRSARWKRATRRQGRLTLAPPWALDVGRGGRALPLAVAGRRPATLHASGRPPPGLRARLHRQALAPGRPRPGRALDRMERRRRALAAPRRRHDGLVRVDVASATGPATPSCASPCTTPAPPPPASGWKSRTTTGAFDDRHQHAFGARRAITCRARPLGGLWRGEENRPYRGDVGAPIDLSRITPARLRQPRRGPANPRRPDRACAGSARSSPRRAASPSTSAAPASR